MRKIVLNTATTDRRGGYRDAGETLSVGAADNADTDLATEAADALLANGGAERLADAKAAGRDPLDHDGDGRKGGTAQSIQAEPAAA